MNHSESTAMTWHLYDPDDADLSVLDDRTVAILGYGNQGRAHAQNLRDSGVQVIVAQRTGGTNPRLAIDDGFQPIGIPDAVKQASVLIVTLPDETAADIYHRQVAPVLQSGQTLGFVHGFNIRFKLIAPPDNVDCIMVAPKGPGKLLRSLYLEGRGLPALLAIEHDVSGKALATALAWAKGIGATRAGVAATTFAAETEADLFGEQVVLCGGVTALMKAAFATLCDAGYQPELAYLECIHELKQVVDLIYAEGLSGMRSRISNTAEYGDLTRGPRLVSADARREMARILYEIRSGAFAKEWIAECRQGLPNHKRLYQHDVESVLERAGRTVRHLMPWLQQDADPSAGHEA